MSTFQTPQNSDSEVKAIQADVQAELPSRNPYLEDGLLRATCVGLGRRVYHLYYTMRSWIANFLPNRSKGEYQKMWMEVRNIQPLLATSGSGNITATGTIGSSIASGNVIKVDGIEYTTQSTETITSNVLSVLSLNRLGSVVTCITTTDHALSTGMSATIAGANEADTNGTYSNIVVTGSDSFTYSNASSATSATGTITCTYTGASIEVESAISSATTNQDGGTVMTFESEITGVNSTAAVQFAGITGGTDAETEAETNKRLAETFAFQITLNNGNHLRKTILDIPGNTRAWVHYAYPAAGEVTAYFVRDDDDDILPSATEEATTLAAVQAIWTAHTDPDDIHISGPSSPADTQITVEVSNVLPATQSMRDAVEATVIAYYKSQNEEGVDDDPDKLKSAIYQTYDAEGEQYLTSMTLESPNVYANVDIGEIATLLSVSVT